VSAAIGELNTQFRVGPHVDKERGGCLFRVWSRNATTIQISGQWDNWQLRDLQPDDVAEFYSLHVAEAQPEHEYRFCVSVEGNPPAWTCDPRSLVLRWCDTFHCYNSVVYDNARFEWSDEHFIIPKKNSLVLYQLHISTFGHNGGEIYGTDGTFLSCVKRLDHLVALGINCIALLPISQDSCPHICWYRFITFSLYSLFSQLILPFIEIAFWLFSLLYFLVVCRSFFLTV
jgi:1,4-alpha-glucan branching enzyme